MKRGRQEERSEERKAGRSQSSSSMSGKILMKIKKLLEKHKDKIKEDKIYNRNLYLFLPVKSTEPTVQSPLSFADALKIISKFPLPLHPALGTTGQIECTKTRRNWTLPSVPIPPGNPPDLVESKFEVELKLVVFARLIFRILVSISV